MKAKPGKYIDLKSFLMDQIITHSNSYIQLMTKFFERLKGEQSIR